MQSSLYSIPIRLVLGDKFHPEILTVSAQRGPLTLTELLRQAPYASFQTADSLADQLEIK